MTESTTLPVKKTNGTPRTFGFFDDLEDDMQRFFRWPFAFSPTFLGAFPRVSMSKAWTPRMDVFEKDGTLVVTAELPGLKKEDVKVEMLGEDLIISGEAKAETEVRDAAYYRTERTFGSFYRRMPLPVGTRAEQIEATLKDGVLEVHIPKPATQKSEPTKVEVK